MTMTDDPKPIDDGGPAFPWESFVGMSLRDYFAGVALSSQENWGTLKNNFDNAAHACYSMADAMIKARKEDP